MEIASSGQLRAAYLRWALVTVPLCVALGMLSGKVAGSGPANAWFAPLAKPALYPPPITFAVVWTVLYVLMGLALAMVLAARGARLRGAAVAVFVVQFAANLAWSPLFFGAHRISAALALLVAIDLLVAATIAVFARVRSGAALLLAPYMAWVLFATLLNWQILSLNPGADGKAAPSGVVRIQM